MLRRLGLAVSYFVAIVYALWTLWPAAYCLQHGCGGPGELDAFMPAFMLTPIGVIAMAFSLQNAIQNIRKNSWPLVFWPLAVIFAIVLLGATVLIGWIVFHTVMRR